MVRFIFYMRSLCEDWKRLFYLMPGTNKECQEKGRNRGIFSKQKKKTPETDLNEMKISDLPDKQFKIMLLRMFPKVRRTMHGQSENFSRERKYRKVKI